MENLDLFVRVVPSVDRRRPDGKFWNEMEIFSVQWIDMHEVFAADKNRGSLCTPREKLLVELPMMGVKTAEYLTKQHSTRKNLVTCRTLPNQ